MAVPRVQITHNSTNGNKTIGQLYLADVGQRSSLGGSLGIYMIGQDCYINPGETKTLVLTGATMLSLDRGILRKFSSGDFAGILTFVFI